MSIIAIAQCAKLPDYEESVRRAGGEVRVLDRATDRPSDVIAGVDGVQLAMVAREIGDAPEEGSTTSSARNRLRGIVTAVKRDDVMAQVELCCGPHRVVSLMSREAADALRLEPGVVAVASVKSTNVVVELS